MKAAIDVFWRQNKYPPTLRDLMAIVGISSTSVCRYVLRHIEGVRIAKNGRVIPLWVDQLFLSNNACTGLAPTAAQDGTGEAGASQFMKKLANLRVCASCEWIFKLSEYKSCPKCGFAHYGAYYVYGAKCYKFSKTQEPWLHKKVADYEYKLWKDNIAPNKASTRLGAGVAISSNNLGVAPSG